MCFKKKRKKSIYVVTERSEDRIPYSIPQISNSESNRDNPLGSFVSSIHGTDVKDDATLIRTRSSNIDNIKSMNQKNEETNLSGFRTVKPQKKKEEEKDTRVDVLDVLDRINKEPIINDTPVIKEEVTSYQIYEDGTPIVEEKVQEYKPVEERFIKEEYKEPIIEKNEDEDFSNSKTKDSKYSDQISLADLTLLNSLKKAKDYSNYRVPPISLLDDPVQSTYDDSEWIRKKIDTLDKALKDFKIGGHVKEHTVGPTFTRFAVELDPGVSGSKVEGIDADLQRLLEVKLVRIENPIPGRNLIGVEVPNEKRKFVSLKEVINKPEFIERRKPLLVPTGLDVESKVKFVSIDNPAHGIIAGQSGSGKSVFINTLMLSLIYQYSPNELKFLCVDPKFVDIAPYEGIPHMMAPIVSNVEDGIKIIKYCNDEMQRRYKLFKMAGVQKIELYHEYQKHHPEFPNMPFIVMIIDEAGSILETGGKELETILFLLTSKARAAGIHIFLSLQKPIAKTLPTTIKSNLGLRFAFSVMNAQDSILILEESGADKLLGKGDMIFKNDDGLSRYQAANVTQEEVDRVVDYLKQYGTDYYFDPFEEIEDNTAPKNNVKDACQDELFAEAARYTVSKGECSTNSLLDQFHISYFRARDLVKAMEKLGIVSESRGTTSRKVLVSPDELEEILMRL